VRVADRRLDYTALGAFVEATGGGGWTSSNWML
jgi:hypothetical protein